MGAAGLQSMAAVRALPCVCDGVQGIIFPFTAFARREIKKSQMFMQTSNWLVFIFGINSKQHSPPIPHASEAGTGNAADMFLPFQAAHAGGFTGW